MSMALVLSWIFCVVLGVVLEHVVELFRPWPKHDVPRAEIVSEALLARRVRAWRRDRR